jgi:hypothetical protein
MKALTVQLGILERGYEEQVATLKSEIDILKEVCLRPCFVLPPPFLFSQQCVPSNRFALSPRNTVYLSRFRNAYYHDENKIGKG